MGYFSNGSEGMDYEARYCTRCLNYKVGLCSIWLVHSLVNYDQFDIPEVEQILSILIPRSEDGLYNEECSMFIADKEAQCLD